MIDKERKEFEETIKAILRKLPLETYLRTNALPASFVAGSLKGVMVQGSVVGTRGYIHITTDTGLTAVATYDSVNDEIDVEIGVNWGTAHDQVRHGDDPAYSNSRTPTSHAISHATGGSDEITPESIGAGVALPVELTGIGSVYYLHTGIGLTIPTSYLAADGAAISRTTYADLFDLMGTTYGPGDGSTTFNLPTWTAPTGLTIIIKAA